MGCKNTEEYNPCPYVSCNQHMIHTWNFEQIRDVNESFWEKKVDNIGDNIYYSFNEVTDNQILEVIFDMPETCFERIMEQGPHGRDYILKCFNIKKSYYHTLLNKIL